MSGLAQELAQQLAALRAEIERSQKHPEQFEPDWLFDLKELLPKIFKTPAMLLVPYLLEQFAEDVAVVFSHLLMFAPQLLDSSARFEIFLLFEDTVQTLTDLENNFFRKGEPNEAIRSLLFQLSVDVGMTPTPTGQGTLSVLDYRYNPNFSSHPDYKGYHKKTGEIGEAIKALQDFERYPGEDTALEALVELGDVFYNIIKMTLDPAFDVSQGEVLYEIHQKVDSDTVKWNQLEDLFFELSNVAIWKFWHRYIQARGDKDQKAEKKELEKKWSTATQNGNPLEFLNEHIDDCYQLLESVAAYCQDVLENEMDRLGLSNQDKQAIVEHLVDLDELFVRPNEVD